LQVFAGEMSVGRFLWPFRWPFLLAVFSACNSHELRQFLAVSAGRFLGRFLWPFNFFFDLRALTEFRKHVTTSPVQGTLDQRNRCFERSDGEARCTRRTKSAASPPPAAVGSARSFGAARLSPSRRAAGMPFARARSYACP
jgi:hypothetical protein